MNTRNAIIVITAILTLSFALYSQPSGTVQFIGGYSQPLPDLKGDFGEMYYQWTGNGNPDTNTFFMKSGISYGIFVKFPVKHNSSVNIIGGIAFNVFSNTVSYNDTSGIGDFDLTQSILGITLGAEYAFQSKKSRFNPFIGAEFMLNVFGGSLTIVTPSATTDLSMNSTTRYGFQFGAGADYVVHNNIGITIGVKYAFANLIGKDFKEDIGTKYNLNDGAYTLNGANYPEKNIQYLQFYGGISFYFRR
jgi:outer membrane protein W